MTEEFCAGSKQRSGLATRPISYKFKSSLGNCRLNEPQLLRSRLSLLKEHFNRLPIPPPTTLAPHRQGSQKCHQRRQPRQCQIPIPTNNRNSHRLPILSYKVLPFIHQNRDHDTSTEQAPTSHAYHRKRKRYNPSTPVRTRTHPIRACEYSKKTKSDSNSVCCKCDMSNHFQLRDPILQCLWPI